MDVLESDLEKLYVLLTPEVRHRYTNRQTCQSLSVEIQPRLNSTLWPVKTSIKVIRSIFSQQMSTLLLWLFLMFVTDLKTTWRRPETIVMCYFGVTIWCKFVSQESCPLLSHSCFPPFLRKEGTFSTSQILTLLHLHKDLRHRSDWHRSHTKKDSQYGVFKTDFTSGSVVLLHLLSWLKENHAQFGFALIISWPPFILCNNCHYNCLFLLYSLMYYTPCKNAKK